jgi:two-component system LytT family response regulator
MEKKLRSIIVDDEKHAIELLTALLQNIPGVSVEKTFTSPVNALNFVAKNNVDLIFLDVQMPELSGIEFAYKISHFNIHPNIVFVTAHDQYLLEALRLNALDFLLKPVDFSELQQAVQRVKKRSKDGFSDNLKKLLQLNQRKKIKFNTRHGFVTFFEDDILYVEADGVYSIIRLVNGKEIIISQNLGKIEKQLSNKALIKIHRSIIVNANYIFEINRGKKECILAVDEVNFKLRVSSEGLKLIDEFICS